MAQVSMILFMYIRYDRVKIDAGSKIATKSKLRGLENSCFFKDQNHNFKKLKGQIIIKPKTFEANNVHLTSMKFFF